MFVEDTHYVRFQKKKPKEQLINALLQYTLCEMKTQTNEQWKQIIAKERQPIYGHKCFRKKINHGLIESLHILHVLFIFFKLLC